MSTFSGVMSELPTLRIDRFDKDIDTAEAFFLSHCHTDHMVGLDTKIFQEKLINSKKFLYGSPISCSILRKRYPLISDRLKPLEYCSPITIIVNNQSIIVGTIPAGHCPGSIMFLFEMESGKNILYTGDYRINSKDFARFSILYDYANKVKVIDKIYLDTTFFLRAYDKFPTREDSLNKLLYLIQEWIHKSPQHQVKLLTSAKYGSEFIIKEIFEKLRMPVFVSQEIFDFYSVIPELDKAVTVDSHDTQIHWTYFKSKSKSDYDEDKNLTRIISTSALRWSQDNLEGGIHIVKEGIHYVCYSTHASYEEGKALLEFLKPKEVHACVDQRDPANQKRMLKCIDECLPYLKENTQKSNTNVPLFEIGQSSRNSQKIRRNVCDTSISIPSKIQKCVKILESPPR